MLTFANTFLRTRNDVRRGGCGILRSTVDPKRNKMAEDNPDGQDRRQGRQPKDLKGLLKFCMENTAAEDAPDADSSGREMSPERKEWLGQVLDEMRGDPIEEVKRHLRVVGLYLGSEQPSEDARANALDSLEELFDWCESLDIAVDFTKIGGFALLHELLTHNEGEFRLQGFRLLGVLVQNNQECQEAAVREEVLPTMLKVLDTEQDPEIQCQALQAISCLARDPNMLAAQQQFVAQGGFEVLKKVLQAQGLFKRVVKIAFFLGVMCLNNPQYKDLVCEAGLVDLLVQELKGEHQQSHEHIMGALVCLATDHLPTQRLLAQPHLHMTSFLHNRMQLLTGKEENEEERMHAEQLLCIQSSASQDSV